MALRASTMHCALYRCLIYYLEHYKCQHLFLMFKFSACAGMSVEAGTTCSGGLSIWVAELELAANTLILPAMVFFFTPFPSK